MPLRKIYLPEMPSTSDFAINTIGKMGADVPDTLLVYCDRQTAGRGQGGHLWKSTSESLTFTWCVQKRAVDISLQPLLSLASGCAVCSSIQEVSGVSAEIKWPNDVLIDLKKVAGILVEKITATEDWFLIGIGVNVNQTSAARLEVESPTAFPPCSLRESTGEEVDKQKLMQHITTTLDATTKNASAVQIIADCNESLALKGQKIQLRSPAHGTIRGKLLGIDSEGHLEVEANGKKNSYFSGSIVGFD